MPTSTFCQPPPTFPSRHQVSPCSPVDHSPLLTTTTLPGHWQQWNPTGDDNKLEAGAVVTGAHDVSHRELPVCFFFSTKEFILRCLLTCRTTICMAIGHHYQQTTPAMATNIATSSPLPVPPSSHYHHLPSTWTTTVWHHLLSPRHGPWSFIPIHLCHGQPNATNSRASTFSASGWHEAFGCFHGTQNQLFMKFVVIKSPLNCANSPSNDLFMNLLKILLRYAISTFLLGLETNAMIAVICDERQGFNKKNCIFSFYSRHISILLMILFRTTGFFRWELDKSSLLSVHIMHTCNYITWIYILIVLFSMSWLACSGWKETIQPIS